MALEPWRTARILRVLNETETTRRFYLEVPDTETFDFRPGQFITVDLPIHEKKNKRWRSYSIASPPDGNNRFELVISYVPKGDATNYIWKEFREGSFISFRGPAGIFQLPEVIDTDLCLIATGTGIAPYRSMLLDLIHHPRPTKEIHLVFGTRYRHTFLYREDMERLQKDLDRFHLHVVLSRQEPVPPTYHKGYVHSVYEKLFADRRPARFYLCGWKNMIDEARMRILGMGYEKKFIQVELYG